MMLWSKNLKTDEEKERFESAVIGSKIVLDRLYQMLSEMESEIDRSEMSSESYDTNNWSHKQAHKNGQRSMIRKIQKLINLDQQKDK